MRCTVAKETVDGVAQPKKKMSKLRKLLIALGVIAGLLVGAWVLVVTPAINKIATEQIQAAGLEGAVVEVRADGAKITMPTLPASFTNGSGFNGTNIIFEFGGLGVDDVNALIDGGKTGKLVLPKGIHFTLTADTLADFTRFSLVGTDTNGTLQGTISNERAAQLANVISDGRFVGADAGTLDALMTEIMLTPGDGGTIVTANLDTAAVVELLSH